ncbi:hypothetical protein N9520_01830, partial [Amylibacter sp.]|nr:hypothetical protein [Amylibacter sp.]
MFNNGGGNAHQFCKLYHNGSIKGSVDNNGKLSLKVKQNDGHSMQYSSFLITGKLDGELTLLSKNARYHPPHKFSLEKRGSSKKANKVQTNNLKKLCDLFVPGLELNTKTYKSLQKNLKTLGYYKGGIDGLFGKGSCKALNNYRSATMKLASSYFSKSLFDQLQRNADAEIKLADKKIYINEDASVCNKATILQNGIRRWNLDNPKAIKQVKSRGLDCNITVGNTPFTQKEAKYFLLQLT